MKTLRMLKWPGVLLTAFLAAVLFYQSAFAAVKVPGRTRFFVNDYANVIDAGTQQELEKTLKDFKKRHRKMEIVVTVIPSLDEMTMDTFLHETAFKWRRIWPFPNESRVHFVVAVKERRMRIGVSHTLERVLTEALSRQIMNESILPEFEKADYTAGIRKGTLRIVEILEPVKNVKNTYVLSYN